MRLASVGRRVLTAPQRDSVLRSLTTLGAAGVGTTGSFGQTGIAA